MKQLLRIDASIRNDQSSSRAIASHFQQRWQQLYPGGKVIYRDLTANMPPHLTQPLVEAFFAPDGDRQLLSLSDRFIAEWEESDTILISTPMYNLSVPSTLKAYIDHIVRVNRTFTYGENGNYKGLLQGKEAILILARGGFYNKHEQEVNFFGSYLESMLRFMGINNIQQFTIEGTANPAHLPTALSRVKEEIDRFYRLPSKV